MMIGNKIEDAILDRISELLPSFQTLKTTDFNKGNIKLKFPRVVSRTLSSQIIERYQERIGKENVISYTQYNIHRSNISFTFALSKKEGHSDVLKVYSEFNHITGYYWWRERKGLDIVIEEIMPLLDTSQGNSDNYVERYNFDMIVRTVTNLDKGIEIIKKVENEIINRR